ncbi:helix-turn-helix domain-containing protein [Tenacibaculum maritimum]|uniref:helix-turn-helix domain-containing protein n=1 Tax=Tenacibaculum maritimum TaxID=107401 RepID=UPI0010A49576|nr:helix-turn-helix domain-containing protein [Tenacibaculum maritimum]MCD9581986.1 helix-turn-helix domain-containing protein [Tenacibaculum maritimum]MCD9584993.1 helix-turn-helix domain-containing protein [Tenacibaculum maritimum]MCD9620441.1 helix-turn-helix domain-containing protein [Tenacibaculum maritimum]MCD9626636.1 helix-turn-helix domain-containing protein [Tenacibaculum maritimum]MCD9629033.1 helix-turn-helix domain-containing protein [Tenacibaculum maritimum]
MKITQIQGIEAIELLTEIQKIHAELILIKGSSETPKKDKLLTRKQTAELLQISLVTLWNWRKEGIIQAYRIGNKIRYKESEIIEALQTVNAK